jgi:hypothetical protein
MKGVLPNFAIQALPIDPGVKDTWRRMDELAPEIANKLGGVVMARQTGKPDDIIQTFKPGAWQDKETYDHSINNYQDKILRGMDSIKNVEGADYKLPEDASTPDGQMINSGNFKRGMFAPQSTQSAPVQIGPLDEARDAIKRGAPRDAVIQRLQQMKIDPSGL